MYGLAYVIIPAETQALQETLDATLAAFKRGGEGEFAREKLQFEDQSDELRSLHSSVISCAEGNGVTWRSATLDASAHVFNLNLRALTERFRVCGINRFEGSLAEIEPAFAAFVAGFTQNVMLDPATGLYGRWLNPLGRWDWWELGGRFNGVIVGDPRPASAEQMVSSGANIGRTALRKITFALGAEASDANADIEANVELVETLLQRHTAPTHTALRSPAAIILPNGSGPDEARWFDNLGWRPISPATRDLLGASPQDDFATLARLAYARFQDHAAAGVAYHF